MKKWKKLTTKDGNPLHSLKCLSLDARIRDTVKNYYDPITMQQDIKLTPRLQAKLKKHL